MKKRVFSLRKYKKSMREVDPEGMKVSLILGWPQACDGLTEEEMLENLCFTSDSWMTWRRVK